MSTQKINVMAFVDWNSQIHNAMTARLPAVTKAARTLNKTALAISNSLNAIDSSNRYEVTLRLYHGWHRGFEETENRGAIRSAMSQADFEIYDGRLKNMRFIENIEFGNNLLQALDFRKCRTIKIHLPNTLREDFNDKEKSREKMVDTALACDLLTHARSFQNEWRIVMAEDDDLIPALFVAEFWTRHTNSKTILIRKRSECKFINLEKIITNYTL